MSVFFLREMKFRDCLVGIILSILSLSFNHLEGQGRPRNSKQYNQQFTHPKFEFPSFNASQKWADSLLKTLSFKQMVGQTLMIPAWSRSLKTDTNIIKAIKNQEVGGIIFFQGSPYAQAYLQNYYQQLSKLPLLISIDGEWGLSMRLNQVKKFPFQMTLAASKDPLFCYHVGYAIGLQCRRMGVFLNYAPDVDVNTNPENPIIGFRSLGDNPETISLLAKEISRGMEDAGVYSCAKHFPGHGNTKTDSHKELPIVDHNEESLEFEIEPFIKMIDQNVKSIMIGHLCVPFLDSTANLPASLSRKIVNDLLINKLNYNGLIITDALNMKGITSHYKPEIAAVKALIAGNDILCFPENLEAILQKAVEYKDSGLLDSVQIARSVRKILIAKHQLKLNENRYVETENLQKDLDAIFTDFEKNVSKNSTNLRKSPDEYARKSVLVLNNHTLPLTQHTTSVINVLTYGADIPYEFLNQISNYHKFNWIKFDGTNTQLDSVLNLRKINIKSSPLIVVNSSQPLWGERSRRMSTNLDLFFKRDSLPLNTVLVQLGNLYAIKNLPKKYTVVIGHENGDAFQRACADLIFGEFQATAILPAKISETWTTKDLSQLPEVNKYFPYTHPQELGFKYRDQIQTKNYLNSLIEKNVATAIQLLVLKNGQVINEFNVGYNPTDSMGKILQKPIGGEHIFDLASITKVASTTLAMMKLYDKIKYKLHVPIKKYWEDAEKYPWGILSIEDFLTHRSGLPAFLPLTEKIKKDNTLKISNTYKIVIDTINSDTQFFTLQLSDSCFIEKRFSDSVWKWTTTTQPNNVYTYKYSDLNMIILAKWIEHVTQMPLDSFVETHFYKPMGLTKLTYKPLEKGLRKFVLPSGIDTIWPRRTIRGIVHDPSAALLGGVSGNAGLFGNSRDLAKIMQMLIDEGEFQGKQYLSSSTIKLFTRTHYNKLYPNNYRGLGFDKPNGYPNHQKSAPGSSGHVSASNIFDDAPESLFGHSGFTGTWAWADPDKDLVFIFLSNRTYPNDHNTTLIKEGIRGKLLKMYYDDLE